MTDYDNSNSGVVFTPHEDQKLVGQGKLNVEGQDLRIVMVRERVSRDKPPMLVLYQKLGPLFPVDSENEKAPKYSGPMDPSFPLHRVAAWAKEKDGRKYLSLSVDYRDRERRENGGAGEPDPFAEEEHAPPSRADLDDDIPF